MCVISYLTLDIKTILILYRKQWNQRLQKNEWKQTRNQTNYKRKGNENTQEKKPLVDEGPSQQSGVMLA